MMMIMMMMDVATFLDVEATVIRRDSKGQSIDLSINQYSLNERHVKTQANTCMTYIE